MNEEAIPDGAENAVLLRGSPDAVGAARRALAAGSHTVGGGRVLTLPDHLSPQEAYAWCQERSDDAEVIVPAWERAELHEGVLFYNFRTDQPPIAFAEQLAAEHPALKVTLVHLRDDAHWGFRRAWVSGRQAEHVPLTRARIASAFFARLVGDKWRN